MAAPTIPDLIEKTLQACVQAMSHQDRLKFADSLKAIHDETLVEHARALLAEAFPEYQTAIFVRNWDEDRPHLLHLLSNTAETIGPGVDQTWPGTSDQKDALIEAERAIVYIGSDEEIFNHLRPGETEHADRTEYQLDLDGGER